MAHLHYAIDNDLATVILNNPPQNRLGAEMLDDLAHGLDVISQSAARALLLRADGPDFSCGGDIVPWPDASISQLRTLFERYMSTDRNCKRHFPGTSGACSGACPPGAGHAPQDREGRVAGVPWGEDLGKDGWGAISNA
jgi:hypothetical protein